MFSLAKYWKWHLKTGIASVLVLFALVHFFYDPYTRTEPVAESTTVCELRPGDPEVRLAVLPEVQPGQYYRAAVRVAWGSVEPGSASYRQPRVVLLSTDKQGDWIPSPFKVCGVVGSGDDFFEEVLQLPEGVVSTRLAFQHRGPTGWIRLNGFSLQQVGLKPSAPFVFWGLRLVWFLVAGWTIWQLRLMRRWSGVAVAIVAGLIAAGMLIPGKTVRSAPDQMADFVRPAQIEEVRGQMSACPAKPQRSGKVRDQGKLKTAEKVESRAGEVVQGGRRWLAETVERLDFNLLAHSGLFFLLGVMCSVSFRPDFKERLRLLSVFSGGVVYAIAAELLQVTELTRAVRCPDMGVNVLGWSAGLAVFVLMYKLRTLFGRSACGQGVLPSQKGRGLNH